MATWAFFFLPRSSQSWNYCIRPNLNVQLKTLSRIYGRQNNGWRTPRTSLVLLCRLDIRCSIPPTHTFNVLWSWFHNSKIADFFLFEHIIFHFWYQQHVDESVRGWQSIFILLTQLLHLNSMTFLWNIFKYLKFLMSSTVNNTLSLSIITYVNSLHAWHQLARGTMSILSLN